MSVRRTSFLAVLLMVAGLLVGAGATYFLVSPPLKASLEEREVEIEGFMSEKEDLEAQISSLVETVAGLEDEVSALESEMQANSLTHDSQCDVEQVDVNPLWRMEPSVYYGSGPDLWWWLDRSKGYNDTRPWEKSTSALNKVVYDNATTIIDENYCIQYIGAFNSTIFVVVKSLDAEVQEAFLEVMDPYPCVTVIFKKGYASWRELEKWELEIVAHIETLWENGVFVPYLAKTINATIEVGILDISHEKVEIFIDQLRGHVPLGVLVLVNGSIPVLD